MTRLRLFGSAGDAAGVRGDDLPGDTVGDLLEVACSRYGAPFVTVLGTARVWVNGRNAPPDTPLQPGDEVAVLPPVSGG